MIKFLSIILIFIIFALQQINANTIAVINLEQLINENIFYKKLITDIELSQNKLIEKFKTEEKRLNEILVEIENKKLILSSEEINNMINNYNKELSKYDLLIENFNNHYQNEIIVARELILKEIINILEKYSLNNNLDLVLDSNSYIIASNAINITNIIDNKLDNIKLELEFKNFEY